MTNATHFAITSILVTVVTCSLAGVAAAQRVETPAKLTFAYEAAALETETGASAVYHNLQAQARRACKGDSSLTRREDLKATESCARDLVGKTIAAINAPRLSNLHLGQAPTIMASR